VHVFCGIFSQFNRSFCGTVSQKDPPTSLAVTLAKLLDFVNFYCLEIKQHKLAIAPFLTNASALSVSLTHLPAFAAERRRRTRRSTALTTRLQLLIDISCPQGAQQQTHRPPLLLSIDGTDGRTDGRLAVTLTLLCILCGQRSNRQTY